MSMPEENLQLKGLLNADGEAVEVEEDELRRRCRHFLEDKSGSSIFSVASLREAPHATFPGSFRGFQRLQATQRGLLGHATTPHAGPNVSEKLRNR